MYVIVSFENSFHGAHWVPQLMGGFPGVEGMDRAPGSRNLQVPFPDGFYNENTSFDLFEETLAQKGIDPDRVCGVIVESYQGGGADFLPVEYAQSLREWCNAHNALLVFERFRQDFAGRVNVIVWVGVGSLWWKVLGLW